jgi:nucleotide-binding universal stress UspA family protein
MSRTQGRSESIEAGIFHRILIADNGTPEGQRAAELGLRLAAKVQAEVVLLGIVEPPNIQAAGEGLPVEAPSSRRRRIEKQLYDYLHLGRSLGLEITAEVVEGWAEKQIIKHASEDRVDLIVIGYPKQNWLQRLLVGSTAESEPITGT